MTIFADYKTAIITAILQTRLKRIEEILGRTPTDDELENRAIQITDPRGGAMFYWVYGEYLDSRDCTHFVVERNGVSGFVHMDCEPLCQFNPGGFDREGKWKDASVEEFVKTPIGVS